MKSYVTTFEIVLAIVCAMWIVGLVCYFVISNNYFPCDGLYVGETRKADNPFNVEGYTIKEIKEKHIRFSYYKNDKTEESVMKCVDFKRLEKQ